MKAPFRHRPDAGQQLADKLSPWAGKPQLLVLGLPRGGVPVAFEVARALATPLDVFVVRKLGVPGQPELAMGAIASGGIRVLNSDVFDELAISYDVLETITAAETRELRRREFSYRGEKSAPNFHERTVILVDDGIATGSTARAALRAVRSGNPAAVIVAAPVVASDAAEVLRREADAVVAVIEAQSFGAVGEWYDDFSQTSDEEVTTLLARATP